MRMLNFRGQTLIEVIIAIAVGTLIITAILGLATRSTRNANFSRANEQASKLAQQGLEVIRNIRDEGLDSAIKYTPNLSIDTWNELYLEDIGGTNDSGTNGLEFKLVDPTDLSCSIGSWCLTTSTAIPEALPLGFETFTRRGFIADSPTDPPVSGALGVSKCNRPSPPPLPGYPADEANDLDNTKIKQVTVVVSWDDPSGSHEAKVASCLALRG